MKRLVYLFLTGLFSLPLSLVVIPSISEAQPAPVVVNFNQGQLQQLVAPIALYPDPLLSQVLVAATYPQDIVDAEQFEQQNSSLRGNDLTNAIASQPWDPSVKYVAQFPVVLAMMSNQMGWTAQLGDAFLNQQPSVMNAVQALRFRAQNSLNRKNQRVIVDNGIITIEPLVATQIYVPYYNPTVVYGPWWASTYPDYEWQPPVIYQQNYNYVSTGFVFGVAAGIVIADALFYPTYPDWRGHRFEQRAWPGHSDWRAGKWQVNPQRRTAAVSFRAANPTRFHAIVPSANINHNAQHAPVNNRALSGQPGAGFPHGPTPVHPTINHGNEVIHPAPVQPQAGFNHAPAPVHPVNNHTNEVIHAGPSHAPPAPVHPVNNHNEVIHAAPVHAPVVHQESHVPAAPPPRMQPVGPPHVSAPPPPRPEPPKGNPHRPEH